MCIRCPAGCGTPRGSWALVAWTPGVARLGADAREGLALPYRPAPGGRMTHLLIRSAHRLLRLC